jgi:hypothetical protein
MMTHDIKPMPYLAVEGSVHPNSEKIRLIVYKDRDTESLWRFRLTVCTRDRLGSFEWVGHAPTSREVFKAVVNWMINNPSYMSSEDTQLLISYIEQNRSVLNV